MDTFLDHHVDEVFFVALEYNGEEEQASCFLVGHASVLDQVHLTSDEEVASCIHEHFGVDLRCVLFQHKRCVEERNRFQTQWITATERQELEVDLRELNVEFTEVTDVVKEDALTEVRFDELVFEGVLV